MKILIAFVLIMIVIGITFWVLNGKYKLIDNYKLKREFDKKYQDIHAKYKKLLH